MAFVLPQQTDVITLPAVEYGIITSLINAGGNTLSDSTKSWAANVHKNRQLRIITVSGTIHHATILANSSDSLVVSTPWATAISAGALYVICEGRPYNDTIDAIRDALSDTAQVLRDVFGAGADISAANPLETHDPKVEAVPNLQSLELLLLSEDAGTAELADDGSSPPYYPAVAHMTNAIAEANPGVAWQKLFDLEQDGTITVLSMYLELEWQTLFTVGGGAGTQSTSKVQVTGDGGTTWVDVTDNFTNAVAVMTPRIRAGVGLWLPAISAGPDQFGVRLVHWTDDAGGVSTSSAQMRSNSRALITYRKS